jgi:hypothetical protein
MGLAHAALSFDVPGGRRARGGTGAERQLRCAPDRVQFPRRPVPPDIEMDDGVEVRDEHAL